MTTPTPPTNFITWANKVQDHAQLIQKIRERAGPNVWCVTHHNDEKGLYITNIYKTYEETKNAVDERERTGDAAAEVTPPEGVVMSQPIGKRLSLA